MDRKKHKNINANVSNIFAVNSLQSQRQDRSFYKSLYNFQPDVELAQFSLPLAQAPATGGKNQKTPAGVINSTQLPPMQGSKQGGASRQQMAQYDAQGNLIEEHPDMENDQYAQEMDEAEYDQEEQNENEENDAQNANAEISYDDFVKIIENNEDQEKNQAFELRKANFIRKNTQIYHIKQGIKTGEHAISFFAKHGYNTPIKFLNCNRAKVPISEFRPYDLVVVDDNEDGDGLDDEYFTISSHGVVQINTDKSRRRNKRVNNKDVIPTEFLSLSEWMQQSTMFNVLTSMKFFKHYLINKIFGLWKGNVRYRRYNRTRQNLSKSLIQMRPDFMSTYLDVNHTLFDMASKLTFQLNKSGKQNDIEEFMKEQKDNRDNQKKHYNERVDDIIKKLLTLVTQISDSKSPRGDEEDIENSKMGQQTKNKSMVLQKQEKQLENRVRRLAQRNAASLGTFIRLIDYMVVEAQVKINQESADLILVEMEKSDGKKMSIMATIQFDPDPTKGMQFNPTKAEFFTQFDKLLNDMQYVTAEVVRVINNNDFHALTHSLISEAGPRFRDIVDQSFKYQFTKDAIHTKINNDFEYIDNEGQKFEKCRVIYNFDQEFNFDQFKAEHKDTDSIKQELDKYNRWETQISNNILPNLNQGLISVNSRKLREKLQTRVKNEQHNMRKYLQELADQLHKSITYGINTVVESLKKDCEVLKSYVEFVKQVKDNREKYATLCEQKKKLEDMKQLLQRHRAKDENSGVYNGQSQSSQLIILTQKIETLTTELQKVEVQLDAAQNTIDLRAETNIDALAKRIDEERTSIKLLTDKIENEQLMSKLTPHRDALNDLKKLEAQFNKHFKNIEEFHNYEEILSLPQTEIPEIEEFRKRFDTRNTIWTNRQDFENKKKEWYQNNFKEQDAEEIVKTVKGYDKENLLLRGQLPKDTTDEVLDALTVEVRSVLTHCPLISALGNKAMQARHWKKVFTLLEMPISPQNEHISLDTLIKEGSADTQVESIEEISGQASGEHTIETQMKTIREIWEELTFTVVGYRDQKDRYIIKDVEDIITQLEDDSMLVSTMMGSKYVTEIRDQVESWEKKLGYISDCIDEWLAFQRQWMYLENIFNAEDIQKSLPAEAKQFATTDKFWRDHMSRTKKNSSIVEVCGSDALLVRFQQSNQSLEQITKSLEAYLEEKRSAFPRFYFLSNDELLEILSQTRNAQAVQPHLSKCFDNIKKIEFTHEADSKEILGMWSSEGEYVPFSESVFAHGAVEFWLSNIEKMMRKTLYDITKNAVEIYPEDGRYRADWLFHSAAQPALTVDMVMWTQGCEEAIMEIQKGTNRSALLEFLTFCNEQLGEMINLVRGNLTKLQRAEMGAMIVLDVHNRDVIDKYLKKVENLNDFEWTRQLRYYWEQVSEEEPDEMDVFSKQTNTRFQYGYEYLGNGPRLVITPLTDKCYMTLTGALHLNFGGAPAGPAGTGKTETTKDLAKALAIQCVVFNCSDGLDFRMMGRFFTGLASGGAWACFDEFNRIYIEVLSVIAQQILTIQSAIRAKLTEFEFNDHIIPLNLRFGVFITMNPGYAGRTELPDNLKALFRPVAMMIPDYGMIAQIILLSEGFETANELSGKMVKLYSLSSEQLSKQDHYDFGMRAVKSVLVMAGALRRKDSTVPENILLIRAMRDSNVPKFLEHDLPLFEGIVNDLFPGVDVPFIDYGQLQVAIEDNLRNRKLQTPPKYVKKIIQLLETMMVRHGVMVVGLTCIGKTTCSHILAAALTQLHEQGVEDVWYKKVNIESLNPKAVSMGELFGETNPYTNEWTEGLVSSIVKNAVNAMEGPHADNKRWIIFDGPVDALWIENMNTVLDDNKMLCLANGQRIKMPETCTMMFEVNDLAVASPATVSRCGMVYLEPVHLGWEPFIQTWKEKMEERISPEHLDKIVTTVTELIKKLLPYIRKHCTELITSVDANLVTSCLRLIEIFLNKDAINLDNKERHVYPEKIIYTYVAFSIIWSLGANLHDNSRAKFSECFKTEMQQYMPEFPDKDIYEQGIDVQNHKFEPWSEQIPNFEYNPKQNFFDILVPTPDTVKYKFLLNTLIINNFNVLMTGETGVGKSVITRDYLMNAPSTVGSAFVNFSGKTTTKNLEHAFEGNLDKKRKNLLGPPAGRKMVFFIDDVNMPQLEKYFAQPPCELLRQAIDSSGFYDTKGLFFKNIKDTRFVCACAPPGGGRNKVTPRLFRHFNMIWVPDLSAASMRTIFTSILRGYTEQKPDSGLDFVAEGIVKAEVEIYLKTIKDFLPTPSKSHYTFNLRDPSKVIQGMLMCNLDDIENKEYFVQLWMHETFRVFRDRLINQEDRDRFSMLCHEIQEAHLVMDWELSEYKDIKFGDFETHEKRYTKLSSDFNAINERLNHLLQLYNNDYTPMNLVFFEDCVQHLSRIARILRQERGNAMLVGVGGSGRRSMAQLGTNIQDMKTFSIEIHKNYKEKDYHEDIRTMLKKAGLDDIPQVFLFSDTQIMQESFLEDINNLLNSGEIPNLFLTDEKVQICEELADKARAIGRGDSRDQIYAYFVQKCRENLHIVLAFSPVGDEFRSRCLQFPSIINCCTMDWYNAWPKEALFSVAHRQLQDNEVALGIQDHLDVLSEMAVFIHMSVSEASDQYYEELRRKNYTTPTSYLDLVKTYIAMLGKQKKIVPMKITRYQEGLRTLESTNVIVDELKKNLIHLRPEIDKKEKETQVMVVNLEKQSKVAAEQEKVNAKEEAESKKMFNEVMVIKKDCEESLSQAMPIYNAALSALNTLNKNDITEMKAYATPPPAVVTVIQAVCCLFEKKQDWDTGKAFMQKPEEFLQALKTYDKDNVKPKVIKQLKKFISDPEFVPEIVEKKSKAGKSICLWVRAIDNYSEVLKVIQPKREQLAEAQKGLDAANAELSVKSAALQKVRSQIAQLQAEYKASQKTLDDLTQKKDQIQVQLSRAEKLVKGLADEAERWTETVKVLNVDLMNLTGNIVLAAGYISYVGTFTAKYRANLLRRWQTFCVKNKIPYSHDFTVENVLGDPVEIREWQIQGLPGDSLSIENGLIVTNTNRWPLMIDPQSQGNKWIRSKEKDNNLQIIKLSFAKFLQVIENSIRMGYPVLLENIAEKLDPSLEPVLANNVIKEQGQLMIKIGDSKIPYSSEFKFFLTTKLANPHYMPEICIKVAVVNFTVTPEGLEDQLLVDVVKYEQPALEQQKDQIVMQLADFKRALKDTEDKILKLVGDASDDILEDEELILVLDQSKQTSIAIGERMREAEQTSKMINENRENYRNVAKRGSILYFVIADLALVDPMYQYSLEFFTKLFNKRLEKSEKSEILEERLKILILDITESFYTNICRGLFEKDKLLYSFLNAANILRKADGDNAISFDEWSFFLRGSMTDFSNRENKIDYIDDKIFRGILGLEETHPNFKDLSKSLADVGDQLSWKAIMTSDEPQTVALPPIYEDKLSPFQKCMLIKVLRDIKTVHAAREFVKNELGLKFIESPPFDLKGALADSSSTTPIIFVLSPGADPIAYLNQLAVQSNMKERMKAISLGQGQGVIAERLIDEGQKSGNWVCLQNCHLSASWMPELEKIQEKQNENEISPDYRLWLTSTPSKDFPVPVLQNGIKITNEPPKGLKANLKRTFQDISEQEYESCKKPKEYKKLLFALAYFHAAILERRKYGAIGWNVQYQWMNSDLETSKRQLLMYLDEQDEVPYISLNYIVASVNYGGRVTDDKDIRLINAMLKKYFTPDVMNDNYKLSKLETYYAPPESGLGEVKAYINSLPLEEDPEVFGLHPNANIAFEMQLVKDFLDTVLLMQPRQTGGKVVKTPEQIVDEMANEMLKNLPDAMDRDRAHDTTFERNEAGAMNSLGVFVEQEITRFNKLLALMKQTLDDLIKAIKGTVVMSMDLESMFNRFLDNKVPESWERSTVGYPSLKPLASWMVDFIQRIEFMSDWLYNGPPVSFWLPAFFFPQGFMTASLQLYARANQFPIDALVFQTHVQQIFREDVQEAPESGVNIHGIFIQGARWDFNLKSLEDSEPKKPIVPFPVIWLQPVPIKELETERRYDCPLYKTSTRAGELSTTGHSTNFVLFLYIPTEVNKDYWIRRGTALLCMTDD